MGFDEGSALKMRPSTDISFNRGEELQKLDQRRQRINLWVIGLALLGVALAILENELLWHNRNIPVISFQLKNL